MDITKNLQIETRRLDSLGIRFRMYEHRGQEVCIVIRKTDCKDDNLRRIIEAGYTYKGKARDVDASLYMITVPKLEELNQKMIKLVELETKRLKTLGNIWFRYKFSEDDFFILNVLDDGEIKELERTLTEMGYSFISWTTQGNISEYKIPISELEKLHGVPIVDASN